MSFILLGASDVQKKVAHRSVLKEVEGDQIADARGRHIFCGTKFLQGRVRVFALRKRGRYRVNGFGILCSASFEQKVEGFGNVFVVKKSPRVAGKQKASVAFAVAKVNLNAF